MSPRILEVPLLEPDSFLTIDVGSDLPEDPTEVCQLLADEKCAAKWWLAIATAYTDKAAVDTAIEVISTGLERSPVLNSESDRAPFLTMLSWLYLRKMRSAPTAEKKALFEKTMELANQGFRAYQALPNSAKLSVPAVLAQGTVVAAVGNFNDALQPFQTVLAAQPNNVYGKLGRARILYFRKNYRGALRLYQEVLRQAPHLTGSADPRIGLGLCFWQLHDRKKSRLAWERVLKIGSSSAEAKAVAHACLGLWYLDAALHGNREQFVSNYVQSITEFQHSYNLGQVCLPALKIASYLFSKHDMVSVGKLTDKVLGAATLPEMLGEALFWKARAAHYAGDLDTALTLYTQASSADPDNVAAVIGKGIVEIVQDRANEALLTFELAVQSHPRSADALFYGGLFGTLYGGETNTTKAREMLENYLVQTKQANQAIRPEALAALSQLWEQSDKKKAYEYLKHVSQLLQTTKMPLPFTLNLGTLAFALHHYEEAEEHFTTIVAAHPDPKYSVIARYNLARVQEARGNIEEARKMYTDLGSFPDAKARLLLLDSATMSDDSLRVRAKQLLDKLPQDLEMRALYAWTLRHLVAAGTKDVAKHAADLEQDFHKQTLTTVNKHDTYALVAIGNIYLSNAQAHPKSEIVKKQRSYMRAGEFFEKALQLDKYNAYAAQGVAIALAETKRAEMALPVFARVRESLSTDVSAFINNANCLMDVGDYTRATDMYGQAFKKLGDVEDPALLALLARAWLARGSKTRDTDALLQAVEWASKAAGATTTNINSNESSVLQFNQAYVQLQYADVLRRKPHDQRHLHQLETARDGVVSAIKTLKYFVEQQQHQQQLLPFALDDLEDRLDQAESNLLPQLNQSIETQKAEEQKAEEKRLEAKQKRDDEIRRQEEAQQQRQREREEREARLAEERIRLQQEAAQWEAERAAEREQQPEDDKKKKKRSRKDADDLIDDSELPNYDSDSDGDQRANEGDHKSDNEGDSDGDGGEKVSRRQNVVDDDEDEDEDEDKDKNEDKDEDNDEQNGEQTKTKQDDELDDLF